VHLCTEHGRREETLRVAVRMGRGMGEASAAASRLKVCRELRLP
jgi:ribosomal protein L16/L10AE